MKYPERIEAWVSIRYQAKYVDAIVDELLDAASEGPRTRYHVYTLDEIFPELGIRERYKHMLKVGA